MAKKIKLEAKIDKLLNHYLEPSTVPDAEKLEALKLAIDWVKTKHKLEQDGAEVGAFFGETVEDDSFLADEEEDG